MGVTSGVVAEVMLDAGRQDLSLFKLEMNTRIEKLELDLEELEARAQDRAVEE